MSIDTVEKDGTDTVQLCPDCNEVTSRFDKYGKRTYLAPGCLCMAEVTE